MHNLLIRARGPNAVPCKAEGVDVLDICWTPEAFEASKAPHRILDTERTKFAASLAFEDLQEYDAVCFADDDLIPFDTWAGIFELFHETGVRVAQPALHPISPLSHEITRQVDGVQWRRTTFVEVMCPILSKDAVREYSCWFSEAGFSAWGLEAMWANTEISQKVNGLGILDATPVIHCRPINPWSPERQARSWAETWAFCNRHMLLWPDKRTICSYSK